MRLPGFTVAERPDVEFSSVPLAIGGRRIISGASAWSGRGEPHIVVSCRTAEGAVFARLLVFPGEPARIVGRAIRAVRDGVFGTVGRVCGRELDVEVSARRDHVVFQRLQGNRRIGRETRLSPEETIAIDHALSWLEHEAGGA